MWTRESSASARQLVCWMRLLKSSKECSRNQSGRGGDAHLSVSVSAALRVQEFTLDNAVLASFFFFPNNCRCYSIQVLVSRSVRPSSVSLGNFGSQRVTPATSPNNSIETLTAGVSHSFPNQYTAIANLSASRLSMDRVSLGCAASHTFHPISYSGALLLFIHS